MISALSFKVLVVVIIGWMVQLQPPDKSPQRAAWYGLEAASIASAAMANPVFGTPLKTAAMATATAFFESGFDPKAMGDCTKGKPRSIATCASFGAFQVSKAYAKPDVLLDVDQEAPIALKLMGISKRVCRGKKPTEALGHYAAGGEGCRGLAASRHRMELGLRLESSAKAGAEEAQQKEEAALID